MKKEIKPKAPLFHRFAEKIFAVLLAILVYWLLGFLLIDIEKIKGPEFSEFETKYVDENLIAKEQEFVKKIDNIDNSIENHENNQRILKKGTENLQKTIGQILEIQKSDRIKNKSRTKGESKAFSDSLNLFLSNQKKYQEINVVISDLTVEKKKLEDERAELNRKIEAQRELARIDHRKVLRIHDLKIAFYKLGLLAPFFLLSVFFTYRYRRSPLIALLLPLSIATTVKVALTIHEHFPSKYFKYVLILLLIGATLKILLYLIRTIAAPKLDVLIKQYREAYERFACPICEYPIKRGPLKYLFWTRKTLKKQVIPNGIYEESEYHCPSCGTSLYQKCESCKKIRHSLLPHCEWCNAEISIQN